jgi:hypothetical protein
MQEEFIQRGDCSGTTQPSPLALQQVTSIQNLHDAHRQYWLVDNAHRFGPASFRLLSCHSAILECELEYSRRVLAMNKTGRDRWIAACLFAMQQLAELSQRNDLQYWCVAAFTHISRFGTIVFHVSRASSTWGRCIHAKGVFPRVRPCHSVIAIRLLP